MAQIAEKTVARQEEADAERLYDQLNMEEGRLAELRYAEAHCQVPCAGIRLQYHTQRCHKHLSNLMLRTNKCRVHHPIGRKGVTWGGKHVQHKVLRGIVAHVAWENACH